MTPTQASHAETKTVFRNLYNTDNLADLVTPMKSPRLKAGDYVRIAFDKNVFDKGYWTTFADAVGIVHKVHDKGAVPMYSITDTRGDVLKRRFYDEELQLIQEPKYRVERIIKTRVVDGQTQYYVKWLGYDSTHNSWVDSLDSV